MLLQVLLLHVKARGGRQCRWHWLHLGRVLWSGGWGLWGGRLCLGCGWLLGVIYDLSPALHHMLLLLIIHFEQAFHHQEGCPSLETIRNS